MDDIMASIFVWTFIFVIFILLVVFAALVVIFIDKKGTYDNQREAERLARIKKQ